MTAEREAGSPNKSSAYALGVAVKVSTEEQIEWILKN